MYKITVIPGDGIGPEVMDATLSILETSNVEFDYIFASAGNECFKKTGTTIPDKTISTAKKTDATLFGAVTTVPGQKSGIISLRRALELYANLRPVKSYKGTKCLFNNVDFVIIRENTEGLYSGIEDYTETGATALRVVTRKASEQICRFAFEYATKTSRKKITAVHKANVLKKTDRIFKEAFYRVGNNYPEIKTEDFYVDATAMYLITKPQDFEVIVTTNLFGDILSDEGAGLVGGLGLVPSANIGKKNGLFEPVHGSAPDIAGKGIANPSAMIFSACIMLDYLEEYEEARKLENAMKDVLRENKIVTPDLGGTASTMEMASEVKRKFEALNM